MLWAAQAEKDLSCIDVLLLSYEQKHSLSLEETLSVDGTLLRGLSHVFLWGTGQRNGWDPPEQLRAMQKHSSHAHFSY